MRRRLVVGIREVTKHLKLKKLKCVILAPNLEKIKSNGNFPASKLIHSLHSKFYYTLYENCNRAQQVNRWILVFYKHDFSKIKFQKKNYVFLLFLLM